MSDEGRPYQAYLLRLWQVNSAAGQVWRASLENAHTGERKGFIDLKSLFAFLEEETSERRQRTGPASEPVSLDQEGEMPMNRRD